MENAITLTETQENNARVIAESTFEQKVLEKKLADLEDRLYDIKIGNSNLSSYMIPSEIKYLNDEIAMIRM